MGMLKYGFQDVDLPRAMKPKRSRKNAPQRVGKNRPLWRSLQVTDESPTLLRDLGVDYVTAFVTFLDILGFRKMVERRGAQEINTALDGLAVFSALPQKRREIYAQERHLAMVLQFSDSIIRVQPVDLTNDEVSALDFFHGEITSLLLAQGNLACNGILVRGGMTFGEVCVQGNRVFGPAFNDAYKIESQLALYPRVAVDDRLVRYSDDNPLAESVTYDEWGEAYSELLDYLFRAEDGLYSLHYLPHLMEAERADKSITQRDVIAAHKACIEKQLSSDACKDAGVRSKLKWLGSYHNRVARRLGDDLYVDLI
jgi:hypothetical protein